MNINYNNRFFRSMSNSPTGEVGSDTVFHYRQGDNVLWATYEGGAIRFGTLCGLVDAEGGLDFRYSHVNELGQIMTGCCTSTPTVLADGRIRLQESWQWTSGDRSSGHSEVEEISPSQ